MEPDFDKTKKSLQNDNTIASVNSKRFMPLFQHLKQQKASLNKAEVSQYWSWTCRRILIDGGWVLVNVVKYTNLR